MTTDAEHLCDGLESQPCPDIGTILVTGATGYVGGRLAPELLARGYRVRVLVRAAATCCAGIWRRIVYLAAPMAR